MHHVNRLWQSVCCSFCEKLVLSWLMAAWTEDAAYANIEQQYCWAHFSKLAKASEKHYHGLTLVYSLRPVLFLFSEFNLWVLLRGSLRQCWLSLLLRDINSLKKPMHSYLFYIVFFFLSRWKLSVEKVFHPRGALFIRLWSCLNAGLLPVCCCRVGTD